MRVIFIPYFESYLGCQIYYEEYGNKKAPPLLVLTGMASNMLQWEPKLIEELADNFRVILMDNRGSGRSGSSIRFYTMKTYAKDIQNLLTHLHIPKAHFFAHSLGASMVQRFVITHPEMADKLVFVSPDIGGFKRKLPSRRIASMFIHGLKTDALGLLKHAFCAQNKNPTNRLYTRRALDCIEKVFRYYPMSKRDYRKQLIAAVLFNTMKKVNEIQNKTLIFTGEYDKIVLPANAVRLARRLPNSTLSVIHNCGHLFLYDDLKPILTELYAFLQ